MAVLGIDHVQLSIPRGRLDTSLPFYTDVLGFTQIPKPAEFADHGGAWLRQGPVELHLGEETAVSIDGRAHPALRVDDLDGILRRAVSAGYEMRHDEGPSGFRRASIFDAFGNCIALMQSITSKTTAQEE